MPIRTNLRPSIHIFTYDYSLIDVLRECDVTVNTCLKAMGSENYCGFELVSDVKTMIVYRPFFC